MRGGGYDSAHASIADWLDEFIPGGQASTTGRAYMTTISKLDGQATPELEFSELQAAMAFKLPEMDDSSATDALN